MRHAERLDATTALEVVADYDVVLDGADNFPTRYLVGDACARLGIPHVWGSVYRFDGQVSVWWAGEGPCYACVFPPDQDMEEAQCATMGVFAPLVGIIGAMQAAEALRLLAGVGTSLAGRLQMLEGRNMEWSEVRVQRDPACRVCGPRRG